MKQKVINLICFISGWIFIFIGIIGMMLPILPTVPFMILAAFCFSKGSPKFHAMLLNNKYFGEDLKKWEKTKTVNRKSKQKATELIIFSFLISISILNGKMHLQIMLIVIGVILLSFIWLKLKESWSWELYNSQLFFVKINKSIYLQ